MVPQPSLVRLLQRTRARFLKCRHNWLFPTNSIGSQRVAGEASSSLPGDIVYETALKRHHAARQRNQEECDSVAGNVSHLADAHFHFSSCFWAWWKSQPNPKHNAAIAPAFLARKYLSGQSQYVNVPKRVVVDLITRSKGVVLADIGELAACGEAVVLPRIKLHDMLEVIDTLSSETTYLPIDEANAQARGLGNMVAFWERLRNVCPRIATYNGPILTHLGEPCKTAEDLDAAMLATRQFWFEEPVCDDSHWDPILEAYDNAPIDGLLSRLLIAALFWVLFCTLKTPHQDLMEYPMQLGESCRMQLYWQWIATYVISLVTLPFPQCKLECGFPRPNLALPLTSFVH